MFLTRSPLFNAQQLRREMNDLFNSTFGDAFHAGPRSGAFPAINVWEDAERLVAEVEVPGVEMADLDVSVIGDDLRLKVHRKPTAGEGLTTHRSERAVGEFTRVLTLPYAVNAAKVEATLKDGVLTIILPKAEDAMPRKIAVKSS